MSLLSEATIATLHDEHDNAYRDDQPEADDAKHNESEVFWNHWSACYGGWPCLDPCLYFMALPKGVRACKGIRSIPHPFLSVLSVCSVVNLPWSSSLTLGARRAHPSLALGVLFPSAPLRLCASPFPSPHGA